MRSKSKQILDSIEIHKQTIRDKQQQIKTLRFEITDLRETIKKLKLEYKIKVKPELKTD